VRSVEGMEQSHVVELEEANAKLRAELDEVRSKIAELEGCENVLKSSNGSLREDYGNLETMLAEAQREKSKADKMHRDKFQKFRQHFRMRLHNLNFDLEKSMTELGG
jgi:chromosome segregation ATPase